MPTECPKASTKTPTSTFGAVTEIKAGRKDQEERGISSERDGAVARVIQQPPNSMKADSSVNLAFGFDPLSHLLIVHSVQQSLP